MTPSQLKAHVEQAGYDRFFFTRNTMHFFGDTMRNYGVRETVIDTYNAQNVPVYELFRRRPVKHGLKNSAYFDEATFAIVFKERRE